MDLPARLAAAPGEGYLEPPGEEPLVSAAQGRFVLDEQYLAPRAGRGGRHWWANIWRSPIPSTSFSARPRLQLEQVVELRQHQEKAQLLVGPAQTHRQPALGRLPLDQHQCTEPRAVDLARAGEIDHQASGTLGELFQQLGRRTAESGAGIEPQLFRSSQDPLARTRRHCHQLLHNQLLKFAACGLCDSSAILLTCWPPTGCQNRARYFPGGAAADRPLEAHFARGALTTPLERDVPYPFLQPRNHHGERPHRYAARRATQLRAPPHVYP